MLEDSLEQEAGSQNIPAGSGEERECRIRLLGSGSYNQA